MNINFICDQVLDANIFAEYLADVCFLHCYTYSDMQRCLASRNIHSSQGYEFTSSKNISPDTPCVIVRFSSEEDYTQPIYRIMPIPKKYLVKFQKNLTAAEETLAEYTSEFAQEI